MRELSFNLERSIAPAPIVLEELEATENGTYLPEVGVNGFSQVVVDVPQTPPPVLASLSVSENGTYLPPEGTDGFDEVSVDVDDSIYLVGNVRNVLRNSNFYTMNKERFVYGVLTDLQGLYYGNQAIFDNDIPTLQVQFNNDGLNVYQAFGLTRITEYPTFENINGNNLLLKNSLGISECAYITSLDPQKMANIDFSGEIMLDLVEGCARLRNFPQALLEKMPRIASSTGGGFKGCASIDEIHGYPAIYTGSDFLRETSRLKSFTYKFDGSSEVDAGGRTVYLNQYIGYTIQRSTFMNLTGFTADTEITDATTYNALKNNPDAWTADIAYSRYNRASAAETITTLPTNTGASAATIRFTANSGSATDEGAISTLTPEEVAVATTKNWTIALT